MTVADFIAGDGAQVQLVDGQVRAMSPPSAAHAIGIDTVAHWPEETEEIGPGAMLTFDTSPGHAPRG